MLIAGIFLSIDAFAQQITVKGIVKDTTGEPVIGANVVVKGTTTGVITDIDGRYTISAPANGILSFSYVGLKDKEEKVNGRTTINIIMETDSKMIDEVVVIGYGTQRRGSVTGAVSAVKGQDMIKTKNENPQNMLTGRIPGLRVWQKSSEPGTFNNSFDVRGMGAPLIIIDGIPRSTEEFQRLNAMDIDDISVLKDASAAIYARVALSAGPAAAAPGISTRIISSTAQSAVVSFFIWFSPSGSLAARRAAPAGHRF